MTDASNQPNSIPGADSAGGDASGISSYLRPRLVGERFARHSIPLEFLKDLAVIEEMVVEVAKWRFLQAHPDRKRSPRGFMDGVSLRLSAVEEGSAVPVISLVMAGGTLFPPENQTYFIEARDAIVGAIAAAGSTNQAAILEHLPEHTLSYFDRIGRSLREGEVMELSRDGEAAPARLTKETRRTLVLASSKARAFSEETTVRGVVPEADQDNMTFQVQLPDGRKLPVTMSEPHIDTILKAFNGYRDGLRVLLQGVARTTRTGRLERIESIEHMSLLDPLDIAARLDELKELQDGWLEGVGRAPSADGLDWLSSAFDAYFPDGLPLPYLYPTEDGDVRAEWSLGGVEASADVDLTSRVASWHELDLATDAEYARQLNLSSEEDWAWLIDRVRSGMLA